MKAVATMAVLLLAHGGAHDGGCGGGDEEDPQHPRVASVLLVESPDAELGGMVFADQCARCHGADATGTNLGIDLTEHAPHHPADYLAERILVGTGEMPSFEALSDEEIAGVVAHLQAL